VDLSVGQSWINPIWARLTMGAYGVGASRLRIELIKILASYDRDLMRGVWGAEG
jgi:hypothetical protein